MSGERLGAAGISGGISGYISTGKLHGAIMGSLESIAFAGVHVVKADLGVNTGTLGGTAASAGMHGAVGGMFSMAEGGKFSSGFLAAGISDLAGNGDSGHVNVLDVTKHAVAGGIGSVLGGGKFGNGAVTGAFGYLYNGKLGHIIGGIAGGAIAGIGGVETGPADIAIIIGGHIAGAEIGSAIEDRLFGPDGTLVIGRTQDLQNLGPNERSPIGELPDQGNPRDNWKQNFGRMRLEMSYGRPIRDASPGDTGGVFLNAERYALRNGGWTLDPHTNYWKPPRHP